MSGIIINPYVYAAAGLADIDNVYSMEFDGVDDSVNIGLLSALNGSQYFSISMWVNPSALTAATDFIFFSIYTSATERIFLEFFANNLIVNISNGSSRQMSFPMTFSTGQWYNIVTVYDGTQVGADKLKCYVDAVAQTNTQVSFPASLPTFTSDYRIGSYDPSVGYYRFAGNIDEAAIWNSDQSAEISDIFGATSTGKTADLSELATPPTAWYRMGD